MAGKKQGTPRVTPEKIAAVKVRFPDASEGEIRRYLRGHGGLDKPLTVEHGKVDTRVVAYRTIHETRSTQAADRILNQAARVSERRTEQGQHGIRVEMKIFTKDGRSYTVYGHQAKGHRRSEGITATYLKQLREEAGQNAREFLAQQHYVLVSESIQPADPDVAEYFDYEDYQPGDADAIDRMQITLIDYEGDER